jgi:hypothetical protein
VQLISAQASLSLIGSIAVFKRDEAEIASRELLLFKFNTKRGIFKDFSQVFLFCTARN